MDYDNFIAMRKIQYTPDYAHISCNIGIRWLQDVFFESMIHAPEILGSKKSFSGYKKKNAELLIPIQQWTDFSQKIISSFRDNYSQREITVENMRKKFLNAKENVDFIYNKLFLKNKTISIDEVIKLLDLLVELDSYSVFNMFLPRDYYYHKLVDLNVSSELNNVDALMICFFEPHRIQVRKKKLEVALKFNDLTETEQMKELKEYQKNYGVYEGFENWIFSIEKFKNQRFLKREIQSLVKNNNKRALQEEYNEIIVNRKNQILQFCNMVGAIYEKENQKEKEKTVSCLLYLSSITTEEEMRHMIECKIFAIVGFIFSKFEIDSTRYDLDELKKVVSLIVKNGGQSN